MIEILYLATDYYCKVNMIGKTKSKDELAFEILFRKFDVRLCGFANKFIANSAESEEIVQEVFFEYMERKSPLEIGPGHQTLSF